MDANDYCSKCKCSGDEQEESLTVLERYEIIMECHELIIHHLEAIAEEMRNDG